MSQWHAEIDSAALKIGVYLTVRSPHRVVRVVTADTLSIQTTTGDRISAVVLDRTADDLRLVLPDGRSVELEMLRDETSTLQVERADGFSSQTWLAH